MKSHTLSKALIGGACAAALLAGLPAHAQIEEIIVTAEKRAENVQDVGISVSAFNEASLELGGIDDVSRLELVVPGVNFAFAGNDAKFNVRGANSTNTFGDNSSIVGAFLDGVYKARASQQTRGFYDVNSVEFLRGPQGTLYGRNTFAGALNVYTNKPTFDGYEGGLNVSAQRFSRLRADAFVNMPITDTFAVRIAGLYNTSSGHIKNLAGPNMGAADDRGLRVTALWEPTEDLSILGRYSVSRETGDEAGLFGYTFLCRNVTADGFTDPFGSNRDCVNPIRGSAGLGRAANGPGGDPWTVAQDYVQAEDLEDTNYTLEVNYDFGAVTLKSISNINEFENDIGFDFDFGPNPVQNGGYDEESEGWSQEFQFNSDYESALQWTAGAYFSDLEDRNTFYIYDQAQRLPNSDRPTIVTAQFPGGQQTLTATGSLPGRIITNPFANNVKVDTSYFGIYGQGEYSVSDQFRLIAGLRYNEEEKSASCGGSNFSGGDRVVNLVPGVIGSSPAVLPGNAQDIFTYNCDAADAITSASVSDFPGEYDNVTWRLGSEYDVNDDVMIYATASTGYLSGSANTTSTTDEQESQVIEAGFRSRFAGNTVQLNGAIHVTEYNNLLSQRQLPPQTAGAPVLTVTDNGGDIEAWGVELDGIWQATDQLTLTGTLAYLSSEFAEFGQGNHYQLYQGQVQSFIDQSGVQTPWSPELTLGASAAYVIDLGDKGTLTPFGQFYYSDEYNTSNLLANDPNHQQESYTKTDMRLIWDAPSDDLSVELFVENIEDEAVLARGNNNSDDIVQTSYLYPRNFGIKLKTKF